MSLRHFALLFAICLVWGLNFVVAKWSLSGTPVLVEGFEGSPPFFFAFMRFFLLYAVWRLGFCHSRAASEWLWAPP